MARHDDGIPHRPEEPIRANRHLDPLQEEFLEAEGTPIEVDADEYEYEYAGEDDDEYLWEYAGEDDDE